MKAKTVDCEQGHRMQADRIGPIGRARCKYALEWSAEVIARMHLQEIALRLMQPRQQDELVTDGEPENRCLIARIKLYPGRRCTLRALLGSVFCAAK